MGILHAFVSAKADGADTSLVRPSNWNAAHTIQDLPPDSDNARDLGSGALRWRSLYLGTDLILGAKIYGTSSTQGYGTWGPEGLFINNPEGDGGSNVRLGSAYAKPGMYRNGAVYVQSDSGGLVTIGASGTDRLTVGLSVPAALLGTITGGGLTTYGLQVGTSGPVIYSGSGAPTISAAVKGSLYLRTDGTTTNNRVYIATDAAGTWTAVTTVA